MHAMRYLLFTFCSVIVTLASGQANTSQWKSLNNLSDYANQSSDEVSATVKSLMALYPTLFEKRSWGAPRYTCPVQLDEFYYNKARTEITSIPGSANLISVLTALRSRSEDIDKKCKELDTYFKLEDYKKDNFDKAKSLINDIIAILPSYDKAVNNMNEALEKSAKLLRTTSHAFVPFDQMLRVQLKREADFLDRWKFNINEELHTGWIEDELEKSITETDTEIKKLNNAKPPLTYPASSMWPSFVEGLESILEVKRRALDEYNHEAKRSDKHSNDVYMSLINYYNGVLVADYNALLGYAGNDNFHAFKALKYTPMIEIRSSTVQEDLSIKAFSDMPYKDLQITPQKAAITKPTFLALNNYVDYINETYRQVSHHHDLMRNLNSSTAYYATLTDYTRKGALSFTNDDFELPLSYFQKAVSESKAIPAAYANSLNAQSEVLLNILKEMNQIASVIETETATKKYESDQCKHLYELIDRTKILFDTWDERKERLYNDVRRVFESYAITDAASSWRKSGVALRKLNDLDHEGLFSAKAYYRTGKGDKISTSAIDESVREVISSEYDNMKGIQKYGRNNGLCPYTPYEDLPKSSRSLSELLAALKPAKENQTGYQHPYHDMVYQYNDIVRYYNKFAELSPVPLLQNVMQPELFTVKYPESKDQPLEKPRDVPQTPVPQPQPEKKPAEIVAKTPEAKTTPEKPNEVRVVRDTVYIEKRDTVYLLDPNENIRSMEGYATNNMVLLLDVSGSMNQPEKLPLLKQSVLNMLSMMRPEDQISIVVFSGKPKVLLPSISFKDEEKIRRAINSLKPSGTTDGNAGLKLAYKVADENYIRGGNNRIILATDGEFTISDDSKSLIGKFSTQDIFISVFNFGKNSMTAKNLEQIATMGKGNYEFIAKDNAELKLIREAKGKRKR